MRNKVNLSSSNKSRPHLLKIFITLAIIFIIVILLLVSAGISIIYTKHIIRDAENEAINLSQMLFEQGKDMLLSSDSQGQPQISVSEKDFSRLDQRIRSHLQFLQIVKVKVFSSDREIVYSTDSGIIGEIDSENERLERALKGEVTSKMEIGEEAWDIDSEEKLEIDVVETYTPIKGENGKVIGSFEVYIDISKDKAEIIGVVIAFVLTVFLVLVCVFGLLIVLMGHAVGTIKFLMKREAELTVKAATAETEHKKAEELEKAYKDLKETQGMLIQAEKMGAIGQLASGVAHEVRNPLGVMMQGVQYLEQVVPDKNKEAKETLDLLKDSVIRTNKIIISLLDFSKSTKLELSSEDVNSILEKSLELTKSKFKDIEVVKEIKKNLPKVLADKNKLEQVFVNIFLNATQAMNGVGKIIIRSYSIERDKTKYRVGNRKEDYFRSGENVIIVEIEDTGIGIPEKNLKKIYEPFFTTKEPDKGTGLGLAVSQNIITMHKGLMEIESQIGKGTKVAITLKIAGGR